MSLPLSVPLGLQLGLPFALLFASPFALLPGPAQAGSSEGDAAAGVRAALERGALAAVLLLGRTDGFLGNPLVKIPLPGILNDAVKLLKAKAGNSTSSSTSVPEPWTAGSR